MPFLVAPGSPLCVLLEAKGMLVNEFHWKRDVLESPEAVLVDFWAAWCPPCHMMNPTIEALAKDHKVFKVNVDTNQPLAARYNISSIPAILIFKQGKEIARHVGVTPESVLRAELDGAATAPIS
jgi:thioredoxin 1